MFPLRVWHSPCFQSPGIIIRGLWPHGLSDNTGSSRCVVSWLSDGEPAALLRSFRLRRYHRSGDDSPEVCTGHPILPFWPGFSWINCVEEI